MKLIQRVSAVALAQGNQPGDGTESPTGTGVCWSYEEALKECLGKKPGAVDGMWHGRKS